MPNNTIINDISNNIDNDISNNIDNDTNYTIDNDKDNTIDNDKDNTITAVIPINIDNDTNNTITNVISNNIDNDNTITNNINNTISSDTITSDIINNTYNNITDNNTIDYKIEQIKNVDATYINDTNILEFENIVKYISATLDINNDTLLNIANELNKKHKFKIDKNKKEFIEDINNDLNINLKLTKLNNLIKNVDLKNQIMIFKDAIGIYQVEKLFDTNKNKEECKNLIKKLLLLMNDKVKTIGDVKEINIKSV